MALGAAHVLGHQVRRNGAEMIGRNVGTGKNRDHAGRALGAGHVDAFDARVRVRRENRNAVAHAGQRNVVDVASLTGQEALVLHPPHRLGRCRTVARALYALPSPSSLLIHCRLARIV